MEVREQLVGFGALSFHHVSTRIELRPSGLASTFTLGAIYQPLGTAYVLPGISLLIPMPKCILKIYSLNSTSTLHTNMRTLSPSMQTLLGEPLNKRVGGIFCPCWADKSL